MKSPLNKNGESSSVIGTIYSYSTLMRLRKDDLIELLNIAQHNYDNAQMRMFNITKHAYELDKALDRACEKLTKLNICNSGNLKMDNNGEIDCDIENHDCKKCWRDCLMKGEEE